MPSPLQADAPAGPRAGAEAGLSTTQGPSNLVKTPDASRCSQPLLPLVTLAAGVFLLVAPRIVSIAVAVYLVITGLLGLNAVYHFFW
jgi:hypothetical protein